MELNVFTEQLEKCYNLLAQQFVLIKQLKDLTISDKTNTEDINTIKTSILNLQNQLNESGKSVRLYDTSRSNTETYQPQYEKIFPLNKTLELNKLYYVKYIDEGYGDEIGALLVAGINTNIIAIGSGNDSNILATLGYIQNLNSIVINSSGVPMYFNDKDRVEIYEII